MSSAASMMMMSWLRWSPKSRGTGTLLHAGNMANVVSTIPALLVQKVISRQSTSATYPEEQAKEAVQALAAVKKVLDDKDTPQDITMDELLLKANVSNAMYLWTKDTLHWKLLS